MRWLRFGLMGVLLGIAGAGMAGFSEVPKGAGIASTVTLAELRDRVRPLLIFAPTAQDARLLEQVRLVSAHAADSAERDLVTFAVPESGSYPAGHRLAPGDAAEARRRFGVKPGEFVVVLVGKDGGEKLRAGKPLSFERLREVIDAMPMRQEEMKAKGR